MKLSTRMTIAMVALVLLTVVAVGGLTYRNLEAVMLPRSFARSQLDLRFLSTELASYVGGARQDIAGFRTAVALSGIVRAHLAGGVDPVDGTTEAVWRQRMASRYAAELTAKPAYDQFRIIAADGKELVRVERSRVDGAVSIVPDKELQHKDDRGYFQAALGLPANDIYVSPVELNQEHGEIETPHVPVLRVAAVIDTPDQKPFGIVIINVDMRPIFREIASGARAGSKIYIVDDHGNYLVHPNPGMEFGSDLGRPTQWQNDFPGLAAAFQQDRSTAMLISDGAGEKEVGGVAAIRLAGGPRVRRDRSNAASDCDGAGGGGRPLDAARRTDRVVERRRHRHSALPLLDPVAGTDDRRRRSISA